MVQIDEMDEMLEAGRMLASPAPGEEVVISGTSGSFPDSDNVTEFANNLFNKVDLISGDGRRWTLEHPEIPQRTGKLNNIDKFDAGFFGIHYKQANAMDPMCRILLEKTAEAVLDAGYNPQSLHGARMGVFVGACFSETEKTWFYEKLQVNGFGVTGCARAMLANRISYWLGVKGPSYTVDTACSSSLYAFEHGYRAIREGLCDAAIVAGCNLCLHPYVSLQFSRLGVLSKDGRCKSFDQAANGYCRSEGVSVMLLQKAKDARRVYATVVHAKTNCDGYKEEGITFPSGPLQQILLEEFYKECSIDPSTLAWVEAHGTGTKVGDPEEVKAIENVFCKNRKGPLQIGSLKSNTGHSEPASGLLSVTKVLIAMETGYIPPNINFTVPRKDIEAFYNGKIKVVTEKTPWNGGMVGVNSFGFGGANCHVLLKWNEKSKLNKGIPKDDLPRLVAVSGRTEHAVDNILSYLEESPVDREFVKLFHDIFKDEVPGLHYRGYTLLSKTKGKLSRGIKECPSLKQPIWFFYPSLGLEWTNQAQTLMEIDSFSNSILKCASILKSLGHDLFQHFTKPSIQSTETSRIISNCVMQIAITKILKEIGCQPDGIMGISYGEIACAYADGCLSLEEAVTTSYHVATALGSAPKGLTALIGMSSKDLKSICPSEVRIISQGGVRSIISGPEGAVSSIIDKAKRSNLLAVQISTLQLHSNHISGIKAQLLTSLQKVITGNKKMSDRWVSTSTKEQGKAISAEYFCQNLISSILLEDQFTHVPHNATVLEVSPQSILDSFLTKSIKKNRVFLQILNSSEPHPLHNFLTSIGRLYELGVNMDLSKLYPEVSYPVSRSTPMISPLIKWDHSDDWYVASYKTQDKITTGERFVSVSLSDEEQDYISGHVIDGRNLYPATGYLVLVWESLAMMNAKFYGELPVVFESVRFNRATNVPKEGNVDFTVTIQRSSGNFEIVESGAPIVTGKVFIPDDVTMQTSGLNMETTITADDDTMVMKSKDIYKELRLRGYHYKGLFRSVVCSDIEGSVGFVEWHNNWVAYMDNLLQMQLLQMDSRGLFVPTGLQRVVIDPKKHMEMINSIKDEKKVLPVFTYKYVKLICSGGIEIRGMNASAISKRKPLGEPVLEKYTFIPYEQKKELLDVDAILRSFVHIALENLPSITLKVVEIGDYKGDSEFPYLSLPLAKALADLPLIQPELTIYTTTKLETKPEEFPKEVNFEDKKIPSDQNALFSVGNNLLKPENLEMLKNLLGAVKEGGYVISRSEEDDDVTVPEVTKCSCHFYKGRYYTLLRKVSDKSAKKGNFITILNEDFQWIKPLQEMLKTEDLKRVYVVSEKDPLNGILGFTNCITKEGYANKVRCFFILDPSAPKFSLEEPFYKKQIEKDLIVNVYKDGQWGSYRHLLLEKEKTIDSRHAYVSFATRGDLSSLVWIEGHLSNDTTQDCIQVYYSALNFRDIMTATGKLAHEVVESKRKDQDCTQGLEFSGRTPDGKRVMGMIKSKGIASLVPKNKTLTWEIPDHWTLEEAATVPCVYATVIYAYVVVGQLKEGETVLVHAGSGGVGQAAIYFALSKGCTVFATVGTPEKREFLKKTFPQLTDRHIGNSRDTSFEQLVMKETNGRGVDIVMNSLAEEKLLASVRCLAKGGRFLELGKFDMANNNPLGMEFLLREASFHGIMLNLSFSTRNEWESELWKLIRDGLIEGSVVPLSRTVFEKDQVESAIRYMAAGKHIGKVLIKIRDEEPELLTTPRDMILKVKPRFYCKANMSYILVGGLGGFGLELADWLVLRRATKLVLSSRSGVTNGYQASRIKIWRSYGVEVEVFTGDVTTSQGVEDMIKMANRLGPVAGIFNLAVVLRDAIFDNQKEEDFVASLGPKAEATKHLDRLSRTMCPGLEQFVIFSSVSCGRGNAGQSNYGMANSIMERICELRVQQGYPGLAIEWGAVGDVGLVANMQEDNMEIVIGGTLPQKIDSCLQVMDQFLHENDPVLASMVVAEKKAGHGGAGNIVDAVINIIGLKDLKSVSLHSTLAELGMDSMMAVEIKQTLEREFEVFLTPQDIRGMTFAKLQDIAAKKAEGGTDAAAAPILEKKVVMPMDALMNLIRYVGDEAAAKKPIIKPSSQLTGANEDAQITPGYNNKLFLLPGIEGFGSVFDPMAGNLNFEAICIQYDYNQEDDSIEAMTDYVFNKMKSYISKEFTVNIVGYSFGGILALEVTKRLEDLGYTVALCILDSSPDLFKDLVNMSFPVGSDDALQVAILLTFVDLIWPQDKTKLVGSLSEKNDWESRMDIMTNATVLNLNYSEGYKRAMMTSIYKRLLAVRKYMGLPERCIKSQVTLIKPKDPMLTTYDDDYKLSKYFQKEVIIHEVEGNHVTVIENIKTSEIINLALLEK